MKNIILLFCSLIILNTKVYSQNNFQELSKNIPTIESKRIMSEDLINLIKSSDSNTIPYAIEEAVNINVIKDGYLLKEKKFDKYYYRIKTSNFTGVGFLSSKFFFSNNCSLNIYNSEGQLIIPKMNLIPHGNFGFNSDVIPFKEVILEFVRTKGDSQSYLNIDGMLLGFQYCSNTDDDIPNSGLDQSLEDCNIDVICEPGKSEFCNQIRSVTKIKLARCLESNTNNPEICITKIWSMATAELINSDRDDKIIISAAHVLGNSNAANPTIDMDKWILYYNYQKEKCNDYGNPEKPHPAIDLMRTIGISFLEQFNPVTKDFRCRDIAISRIIPDIPIQYNVYKAGWTLNDAVEFNSNLTVIHHPRGDVKKITRISDLDNYSKFCILNLGGWCKVCNANSFDGSCQNGALQKGSSGCAAFDRNKFICSIYSGGPHSQEFKCNNVDNDFTKFNKFFEDNANVRMLLASNKEIDHLNGLDIIKECPSNVNINGYLFPMKKWENDEKMIIQSSDYITCANQSSTSFTNYYASYFNSYYTTDYRCNYEFDALKAITFLPGFSINCNAQLTTPYVWQPNQNEFNLGTNHVLLAKINNFCNLDVNICDYNYETKGELEHLKRMANPNTNTDIKSSTNPTSTANTGTRSNSNTVVELNYEALIENNKSINSDFCSNYLESNCNYYLFNLNGQLILNSQKCSNIITKLNELPLSIYFIKVQSNSEIQTFKIINNK
jgi:hypothetical protein